MPLADNHTIGDSVKMYFALNGALLDAGIAAWDAKRIHDCIRPVSAIQYKYFGQQILAWGGPDQGTQLINGEAWQPYQSQTFVTPPFSEFVSGAQHVQPCRSRGTLRVLGHGCPL